MLAWEKKATRILAAVRLGRIRGKLIAFAMVATLVPSLAMGWLSYRNNSIAVTDKVRHELTGLTSHASRALDLWLRERQSEVRVFASSYEVSENLVELAVQSPGSYTRARSLGRLEEYLTSVASRVGVYESLAVFGLDGTIVAASGSRSEGLVLPTQGSEAGSRPDTMIGEPLRHARSGVVVMTIAEPIRSQRQEPIGFLAAEVRLDGLDGLLRSIVPGGDHIELYAMRRDGEVIVSSRPHEAGAPPAALPATIARRLFADGRPSAYRGHDGVRVVGTLQRMEGLSWGVVAETEEAIAFAPLHSLRRDTLWLTGAIVLAVGLAAYVLGLTIVRPLHRLTRGAAAVAEGDLDVEIPLVGGGEVVLLTRTFNEMVSGLRAARQALAATNDELREKNRQLHELSITDGLTGLFNRSYLTRILDNELERSRRHQSSFAVMMIDIDHFKRFNDTHGHLAGDNVLRETASVLTECVRSCDYVARFGGEEFLVLLPETGTDEAGQAGERIRAGVEEHFADREDHDPITVSVGVASFPDNGDEIDAIVHAADEALYEAKRSGRNRRVVKPPTRGGRRSA